MCVDREQSEVAAFYHVGSGMDLTLSDQVWQALSTEPSHQPETKFCNIITYYYYST